MKLKFILFLFLCIGLTSCKTDKLLPKDCHLKKVQSFNLGIQKIKIYDISGCTISNKDDLKEFPNVRYWDNLIENWHELKLERESYINMEYDLSRSLDLHSENDKEKILMESILNKIIENPVNFFISGIFQPMKSGGGNIENRYYYQYIIDIDEQQLIYIDSRYVP